MRIITTLSVVVVLLAMTLLLYWPVLSYDFVYYDDYGYVVENEFIRSFSGSNFLSLLTQTKMAYWGPSTYFSFAIDYHFWQFDPFGYHLSNLIWHSINVLLLFFLIYYILRLPRFNYSFIFSQITAAFAALLFAIHPQNVEPVVWIASRKDVLSLAFFLLTVLCYFQYSQAQQRTIKKISYFAAIICFMIAIGAKPIVMTLPVILLLFDVYLLRRLSQENIKKLLLEKVPFFLLALIPALLTVYGHAQSAVLADLQHVSLDFRLLNAAQTILLYLSHAIIPLGFSVFYPLPRAEELTILPLIAVILITLFLFLRRQSLAILLMAWLFFLITLFPVLGMVSFNQIQAGADRFVYLPILPFYALFSLAIMRFLQDKKRVIQIIIGMILCGLIVTLFLLTRQQQTIWRNDVTLWQHALQQYPEQRIIREYLATAYQRTGQPMRAIEQLKQAIKLNPNCLRCYKQLAELYLQINQPHKALTLFTQITEQVTDCMAELDSVYFNMALLNYQFGNIEQALHFSQRTLQCNPHHSQAMQLKNHLTPM
jgi:protein O-mannosyl-transferase